MRALLGSLGLAALAVTLLWAVSPLNITMTGKVITGASHPIIFTLDNPGSEAAITRVFTLQGQDVAELTAQSLSRFVWDGKDIDQQDVASGLYVVQIHHGQSVWHSPVFVNR